MHVFCDESGNTGSDLLRMEQPIFAIASTCLEAEAAKDLVGPLLRKGQSEVKYSKLKGTASGQDALIRFLSSPELGCSFACRIDPLSLTLPPLPGERCNPVVRPLES